MAQGGREGPLVGMSIWAGQGMFWHKRYTHVYNSFCQVPRWGGVSGAGQLDNKFIIAAFVHPPEELGGVIDRELRGERQSYPQGCE